jgi:hypothetical protein
VGRSSKAACNFLETSDGTGKVPEMELGNSLRGLGFSPIEFSLGQSQRLISTKQRAICIQWYGIYQARRLRYPKFIRWSDIIGHNARAGLKIWLNKDLAFRPLVVSTPFCQMLFEQKRVFVWPGEPLEEMFLLTFDFFPKIQYLLQLWSGINQLRWIDILKEQANSPYRFLLIEFEREFPLFFRARTLATPGFCPPSVVKEKDRIVTAS